VTWFLGIPVNIRAFDRFVTPPYILIPHEERHLTLVYLGERKPSQEVLSALTQLKLRGFKVCFRGLTPFPSFRKPRYLVTLPEEIENILHLRKLLMRILPQGLISDKYSSYRPHVSIARTRVKPNMELLKLVERIVRDSRNVKEKILVNEICLYEAMGGRISRVWSFSLRS